MMTWYGQRRSARACFYPALKDEYPPPPPHSCCVLWQPHRYVWQSKRSSDYVGINERRGTRSFLGAPCCCLAGVKSLATDVQGWITISAASVLCFSKLIFLWIGSGTIQLFVQYLHMHGSTCPGPCTDPDIFFCAHRSARVPYCLLRSV